MERFAVIEFEEYPDQWARVRLGVSVIEFEAIVDATQAVLQRFMPPEFRALCEAFAPALDSWSYPEEPNAEGLLHRDPNWLLALSREFMRGVREVPLPLLVRSSDTAQSEDPSPENSPEPTSTTTS